MPKNWILAKKIGSRAVPTLCSQLSEWSLLMIKYTDSKLLTSDIGLSNLKIVNRTETLETGGIDDLVVTSDK